MNLTYRVPTIYEKTRLYIMELDTAGYDPKFTRKRTLSGW